MRSDTRSALARHRSMRRAFARAMRQALHDHRAAVIGSLKAAFTGDVAPSAPPGASARERAAVDPREHPAAARDGVWELWPESAGDADATAQRLQARVLRVIENHPEGVCALDLGNELGVDWRGVLGITRTLMDAGKVEQVEHEFYPVEQAGRRW